MLVRHDPPVHLTYCLNVHPGESWDDNFSAIRRYATAVRDAVVGGKPFGLGLRLGAKAAGELLAGTNLAAFREYLKAENMYVFTINGFPYGRFHGGAVKQDVYAPDWRTQERLDYTLALAEILANLLPEGVSGSISTVPGSYRPWIKDAGDIARMAGMLAEVAARLAEILVETGRHITLGLEGEPDCYVESTDDAVKFFLSQPGDYVAKDLQQRHGLSVGDSRKIIRNHLGVCLDVTHSAVLFEDPAECLKKLAASDITVAKVQLGSAIRLSPTPQTLGQLRGFCEDVYLHQVRVRMADGKIVAFADLPDALKAADSLAGADEWRVHFHVPLYFREHNGLASTSGQLIGSFADAIRGGACQDVEIETYTMGVLPESLRPPDITRAVIAEYRWVMENIFRQPSA
ncbi:MAG: metabolite traffic protein EboE [Planctomycetes bacterium]|nr:metabolite traffic protein EboE [Planctomycetota bacterium]